MVFDGGLGMVTGDECMDSDGTGIGDANSECEDTDDKDLYRR
jgi:hypothetical protein